MLRNKLVRSDGSIIDSSVIISCEFTEEVNSNTNLTVGDVTSSELTVEILATDPIQQDETLIYSIIEDGVEKRIGVFKAEKPTVATRTTMRFSAYDNIIKTEKQFSDWLRDNQSLFPMTLLQLVQYACTYSGVVLATTDFPHADLSVAAFYGDGITCRQIIAWAGEIAGRFVRANANGELEFAWYRPGTGVSIIPSKTGADSQLTLIDDGNGNVSIMSDDLAVSDDGAGNVTLMSENLAIMETSTGVTIAGAVNVPFFIDGLSYESYTTDLIERVQINHSEDDVGIIYPIDVTGNCFTISENMILGAASRDDVTQIATDIYTQLKDVTYVPFNANVLRTMRVRAGDIISVTDSKGNTFTSYVMRVAVTAGSTTLTATGDKSYGSNAAVSSEKYSNLTGKMLSLSKSIDGLVIKNEDLTGQLGSLELSTESFKTVVQNTYVSQGEFSEYQNTVATSFEQTSDSFNMKFDSTSKAIADLDKDLQEKYNERTSYIRFEDGNIILGRSDSDITLVQTNDKIAFRQNGREVAYIADDNLYITQGEFMTQLRIGKFGFTPGANGNLSFKKVVN